MSWAQERIKNMQKYPADFDGVIEATRFTLFNELVSLLVELQTTGGSITPSIQNINRIDEILLQLGDKLFEPESQYLLGLQAYLGGLVSSANIANAALKVTDVGRYQQVMDSLVLRTQRLFDKTAVNALLTQNLRDAITSNVVAGARTIDMADALRSVILGDEQRLGFLTRYAKTWTLTGFATAERQYLVTVAEDRGVTRWRYSGGTVEDSREFCVERQGRVFTTEEVKAWAVEEWQGKAYGTDEETIFMYLGGYNCMHVLSPEL
jgi:hypothetical protein